MGLIAPVILARRIKRGKEHPQRWVEKQGRNLALRPQGTLIWFHAVGLGEVQSLRGIIARLHDLSPELSFLVTSSTAVSGTVFTKNLPPRTQHGFLPIDAPRYRRRFLDHFRPDAMIWVEQDLWPGFVLDLSRRGIPQGIIAARMTELSHQKHARARALFSDLYRRMTFIFAQDQNTAERIRDLGGAVSIGGSLKPAAPALPACPELGGPLENATRGRFVWACAPAHPDAAILALAVQDVLRKNDPSALLIIAPRYPDKFTDTTLPRRSRGDLPEPSDAVWLCDSFGELGAIYRLAQAVLIGGTFGAVEGHNPWEAARLDAALLHGPRVANFQQDFRALAEYGAATKVTNASEIAAALQSRDLAQMARQGRKAILAAATTTDTMAQDILAMQNQA